jgi:hypothetical protein
MKTSILGPVLVVVIAGSLALAAAAANAQVGELYDAKLTLLEDIKDPEEAAKTVDDAWIAFGIPQIQTERSPCCWQGSWKSGSNDFGEAKCELNKSHRSYGTRSDSPIEDTVIVYNHIKNGVVDSTLIAGVSCPVDAGGSAVAWIGSVEELAGIEWLAGGAEKDDSFLYALALHRSDAAGQRLSSIAKSNDREISEQAVFWLGEARGQQGFHALEQLLNQLPVGGTRRQINFALAQNDSTEAVDLLVKIAQTDKDPEQRSDALFWLAQEYPQQAKPILMEFVQTEQNEEALEQAVFAISQLGDNSGDEVLMAIARDKQASRELRRHALFWLAQSENDETVNALAQLLSD